MIDINRSALKKILTKKILVMATMVFAVSLSATVFFMTANYGETMASSSVNTGVDRNTEDAVPTIVIDAGHGGFDAGASGTDGTTEKEINLSIAMKLKEVAEEYPVKVILTREGDAGLYSSETKNGKKREDLLKRKEIMKEAGATLAVSIHLNSFPSDPSVYGAQVFYPISESERTGEQEGEHSSKDFAEAVQQSLENRIDDGRERSAAKKGDILLFQNPPCRIILVECGFLSNQKETESLKTEEYQQKLAEAIWAGINENLCLEKKENLELIDSANRTELE